MKTKLIAYFPNHYLFLVLGNLVGAVDTEYIFLFVIFPSTISISSHSVHRDLCHLAEGFKQYRTLTYAFSAELS